MLDMDRSETELQSVAKLAMAQALSERARIPVFMALAPERVPIGAIGRSELDAGWLDALCTLSAPFRQSNDWAPTAAWIDAALGLIPSDAPRAVAFDTIGAPATALLPHDEFFRMARSSEAASSAYPRGILMALKKFHDEAHALDPDVRAGYAVICQALMNLLRAYLRLPLAHRFARARPGMTHDTDRPMRRWIVGHHIFAIITQGVIWALQRFEQAQQHARFDDAESALRLTTELFAASAAAFRFAAGRTEHY